MLVTERIEDGFKDEYDSLVRHGVEALLRQGVGELLWDVYRRGFIRGHAERSREVQAELRSTSNLPLAVHYEGDKLVIGGREIVPERTP